jgi:adenosylmethionine-8-amino-7-oxononanoate aminotransferase
MGALGTGCHVPRRALYEEMLSPHVSHVSACYPYRGIKESESTEEYVARLAQELEDEFQRVGPDTVCAFVAETVSGGVSREVPTCSAWVDSSNEYRLWEVCLRFLDTSRR